MAHIVGPPEYKHVKCDTCKATIAYCPEDVEIVEGKTGFRDEIRRVKCPRASYSPVTKECTGYGYV
jgi:Pyruvate/2-oxoacid:ferredoxin oxidoreductase delta subunit